MARFVAFLLLLVLANAPVGAEPGYGTVRVYNNSDHEIYVVIGGYNQGPLWKGSSDEYEFVLGSHKVEAWVGDEVAREWVTLSAGYPTDEATFNNDDFPEAPRPR